MTKAATFALREWKCELRESLSSSSFLWTTRGTSPVWETSAEWSTDWTAAWSYSSGCAVVTVASHSGGCTVTSRQNTSLIRWKIHYRCCGRSRFLFAEAVVPPASSLGCCASQPVSSAAIDWRGGTRSRRSFPVGRSAPDSLGKPRPRWTTSSRPVGGSPSSSSRQSSPGHLAQGRGRGLVSDYSEVKHCNRLAIQPMVVLGLVVVKGMMGWVLVY